MEFTNDEIEWLMEIDFDIDEVLQQTPEDHLWAQACLEIEVQQLTKTVEKQAEMIRLLEQRLANAETAILWCGESCFDEMSDKEPEKYIKM